MALSYYVCGQAGVSAGDTVVIPLTADVPRSSPSSATIIALFTVGSYLSGIGSPTIVSDDAAAQDAYSLCIFDDGLNHWDSTGKYPCLGLIVNDLASGVNNITCFFAGGPYDQIQVVAVAITGAAAATTSPPAVSETAPVDYTANGLTLGQIEAPLGGGASTGLGPAWGYNPDGSINFTGPAGASDENWDWLVGDVAFYYVSENSVTSDPGTWVWADGSIDNFVQFQVDQGIGRWSAFALGIADPISISSAGPTLASGGGGWSDAALFEASGSSVAFFTGAGPVCTTPPSTGNPCFNARLSLRDPGVGDLAPAAVPMLNARFRLTDNPDPSGVTPSDVPMLGGRFRLLNQPLR